MDKVIAQALLGPGASPTIPPQHPVATTIRDATLLLDLHMDQLAGPLALVAHDLAGRAVQLPQPRHLVAGQHRMDR